MNTDDTLVLLAAQLRTEMAINDSLVSRIDSLREGNKALIATATEMRAQRDEAEATAYNLNKELSTFRCDLGTARLDSDYWKAIAHKARKERDDAITAGQRARAAYRVEYEEMRQERDAAIFEQDELREKIRQLQKNLDVAERAVGRFALTLGLDWEE